MISVILGAQRMAFAREKRALGSGGRGGPHTHSKLRCTVIAKQDKGRFVFGDRVLLLVQVGLELRILLLQPSQRWVTGVYYYAQTKFSNIE